ncbi:MAG: ABC transporter ATP-binding protein [Xanthobacteraceae bacterium]
MTTGDADSTSKPDGRRTFAPWADPAARPLVRIDAVSKRFGGVSAVEKLSLDIFPGEFFALLGPSGCGKTTLLRMLAGFETPSEGRILLDGEDISGVPPHRRPVNMMFQSYALFPHLSVEGNVAFGLKQDRLPRDVIAARVAEMLALVRLEGLGARKPHQLSGGQRQRVALARALAKQPKVLLLDEPLGALDKKLREQTQFELMNIQDKVGITFIVVTHDQEEAMTLATRIAVMDKGIIRQTGTPTEIYEYPKTRFVADFIGSINLFDGEVKSAGNGSVTVTSALAGKDLFADRARDFAKGTKVAVAVRPEKIEISRRKPAETRNAIRGKVVDLGYFGKDSLYRVRLPSGVLVRVNHVNGRRAGENERVAVWEDEVWLSWEPASAIVLAE